MSFHTAEPIHSLKYCIFQHFWTPNAMTAASMSTDTLTEIAGQSVVQLARQFDTPVYVYDAAKIAERIADLAAFDVVRYAQKACSNIAILDLVRRNGALVDCVSAGEIHRAIAAGFKPGQKQHPPEIVYTADIFDREALELVLTRDIHVNCGSPDMIDQYGEARGLRTDGPPTGITLRINPGFGHGHSQKVNTGGAQSKHGIWHEQLEECIERATKYNLSITALHMHIGSGTDLAHLSQVCGAMEKAAKMVGSSIRSISAGGGLSVPYREGEEFVDLAPTSSSGMPRAIGWQTNSATRYHSKSNPAATWLLKAGTSSAKSAP